MAPASARICAALLVGLLAPAAAIQTVADEKTVLTGFDLQEFMSGFFNGAAGAGAKGFDRIKECSKFVGDLKGVGGALGKFGSQETVFEGLKEMIHLMGVTGPEFQACKRGLTVGARNMQAMFTSKPENEGFLGVVKNVWQPIQHFTEIKNLATDAGKLLKDEKYKEAGESMGKLMKVAGWIDIEPPKEITEPTKSPKSKGLFDLFTPKPTPSPAEVKSFIEGLKKKR